VHVSLRRLDFHGDELGAANDCAELNGIVENGTNSHSPVCRSPTDRRMRPAAVVGDSLEAMPGRAQRVVISVGSY
jgi:hypothetical protein